MSVLIKGMEMPNTCKACVCSNYYERMDMILCDIMDKQLDEKQWKSERHHDCPLIEVPTPHGRLGDLDALWDRMYKYSDNDGAKMPFGDNDSLIHIDSACFMVEEAPTVIEAEGENNA